jgi:hypothetical protein
MCFHTPSMSHLLRHLPEQWQVDNTLCNPVKVHQREPTDV